MRALVTALLLVLGTSAGAESICVSAVGNTRDAETLANAFCTDDPGFASGYDVKITPEYITIRVTILPSRLDLVRSDADALKAAHAVGDRLLRLSPTVYVAFVPVRIGNDEPFRTVRLGVVQAPPSTEEVDIPQALLKRIRGVVTWDGDTMKLTAYNGTEFFRVTEIHVRVGGGPTVILTATKRALLPDDLNPKGLRPSDTGAFEGKGQRNGDSLGWEIVAARGTR